MRWEGADRYGRCERRHSPNAHFSFMIRFLNINKNFHKEEKYRRTALDVSWKTWGIIITYVRKRCDIIKNIGHSQQRRLNPQAIRYRF